MSKIKKHIKKLASIIFQAIKLILRHKVSTPIECNGCTNTNLAVLTSLTWKAVSSFDYELPPSSSLYEANIPSSLGNFIANCKVRHNLHTADIASIALITRLSRLLSKIEIIPNVNTGDSFSLQLNSLLVDDSLSHRHSCVYFCEDKHIQLTLSKEQKIKMIKSKKLTNLNELNLLFFNSIKQLDIYIKQQSFFTSRPSSLPTNLSIISTESLDELLVSINKNSNELKNDDIFDFFSLILYPEKHCLSSNPVSVPFDTKSADELERVFDVIVNSELTLLNTCLKFDQSAQVIWDKWSSNAFINFSTYNLCAKIAGVFHVVTESEKIIANLQIGINNEINLNCLMMAIDLTKKLNSHHDKVRLFTKNKKRLSSCEVLTTRLKSLNNPFSLRDLQRKKWKNLTTRSQCEDAISNLIQHNYIQSKQLKSLKGRRITRYFFNPCL